MISLIEAKNYRCLRYIRQPLEPFQVLVGPNASGKTTFLDVVAFISDLLSGGLNHALSVRTKNFDDLLWQRIGEGFELAVELDIPDRAIQLSGPVEYNSARYELGLRKAKETGEVLIEAERLLLQPRPTSTQDFDNNFPQSKTVPDTIFRSFRNFRVIVNKNPEGNDIFVPECDWIFFRGNPMPSYKLGPRKSALGNLPEDETNYPVATWVKSTLTEGMQRLMLNSLAPRMACPPGKPRAFLPDGSNLPWVIEDFKSRYQERFGDWIAHLQTALPDLIGIRTVEREDDRHRYLVLEYGGGLSVPSWMASDGTLRLLALTLPAYLPDVSGTFMIEEPENGIHPRAVQTMFESLSNVYDAQVFCATHSPVVLGLVEPKNVLCFAKTEDGATDIVSGDQHPALAHWNRQITLSEMFVAGVLG